MRRLPSWSPERGAEALALARDTWWRAWNIMRRTPGLFAISLLIGAALWVFVTDVENPTVVDVFPAPIIVEPVNVGDGLAVASTLPAVEIRVAAPQDRWERLNPAHFRAYVDLRDRDARQQEVVVQVEVEGISGVRVVDTEPRAVVVNLEDLVTAEVPVATRVIGTLPIGYELVDDATPDVSTVHVTGPESLVAIVSAAVASVNVTGLTVGVDQSVRLQPQGAGGGEIVGVRLEPNTVRVSVDIAQRRLVRTVPLAIEVMGEPAPGYRVTGVAISPSAVQVEGPIDELQQLDGIGLPSINIAGARSEIVRSVAVPIPPGVQFTGRDRATVTIGIEPISGSMRMQVPVEATGLAEDRRASFSPANVEVLLEGPLPLLNVLASGDVRALVDLAGRGTGTAARRVEIVAPEGIDVASVQPESVEVTISAQ